MFYVCPHKKYFMKPLLWMSFCLLTGTCLAQKKLSMKDAVLGLSSHLAINNLVQPHWQKNTSNFIYGLKNQDYLLRYNAETGFTDTVFTLADINTSTGENFKKIPSIQWISEKQFYVRKGNTFYKSHSTDDNPELNFEKIELPEGAENITLSPDKTYFAFTKGNVLNIQFENGEVANVSGVEQEHVLNGQSVHRNEFGINGGIFWSPSNEHLAYYRMDESMVNDYPIIDWSVTPAQNKNIKYPMAGGVSHHVTLHVYHLKTRKTTTLATGLPADHYLTCVTWSPDDAYLFVGILNREQNHLWLNQYDAHTGQLIKTLFEESSQKYVEPQHALTFLPGKNDEFIWRSQKDGFMHLYVYTTEGKLKKQITKGPWLVNSIVGFQPSSNEVIITASKEDVKEVHSYAVNYKTGHIRPLDIEPGVHHVTASSDGRFVYDWYHNSTTPRRALVRRTSDLQEKELLHANNPLKDFALSQVRNITLKAEDGTVLFGKLMLPHDFDSTKKYPVIVYLYNGPHVQLIKNSCTESGNLWYDLMTQKGYIVFSMDGRGSSNRGLKFETSTWHHLGKIEMEDQLTGVQFLKNLSFVDSKRLGVHGWSFGGFMTTSLMLHYPEVFKAAVAGGPVMDWSMYEVMYTERYMGTPKNNSQGYAESNLLTKTKNIKGKLLLIHGTDDDVVVWQHSINFLKNCVNNGVQVDYFVYPGHPHNVRGKDRVHLMQKITDYFDQNL